jgi:hypothetical protein
MIGLLLLKIWVWVKRVMAKFFFLVWVKRVVITNKKFTRRIISKNSLKNLLGKKNCYALV